MFKRLRAGKEETHANSQGDENARPRKRCPGIQEVKVNGRGRSGAVGSCGSQVERMRGESGGAGLGSDQPAVRVAVRPLVSLFNRFLSEQAIETDLERGREREREREIKERQRQ
jgi:hypothetical protein